MDSGYLGYFDHPDQTTPAHDPGLEVSCPLCDEPLHLRPRRSISLMLDARRDRCYFYRAHKDCYDSTSPAVIAKLEGQFVDEEIAAVPPL